MTKKRVPSSKLSQGWIGAIIAEWTDFERVLDRAICDMAGVDIRLGVRRILLDHVHSDQKIRKLVALFCVPHISPPGRWSKRLDRIVSKANKLRVERNKVVHGDWIFMDDEPSHRTYYAIRRRLTSEHDRRSPADLKKTAERIRALSNELDQFMKDYFAALKPSA